jgi:hypothetical protein
MSARWREWLAVWVLGPPSTKPQLMVFAAIRFGLGVAVGQACTKYGPSWVPLLVALLVLAWVGSAVIQTGWLRHPNATCEFCGTKQGIAMIPRNPASRPTWWQLAMRRKDMVFLCSDHFEIWVRLMVHQND